MQRVLDNNKSAKKGIQTSHDLKEERNNKFKYNPDKKIAFFDGEQNLANYLGEVHQKSSKTRLTKYRLILQQKKSRTLMYT